MTSDDDIKGDGFEVLGHEQGKPREGEGEEEAKATPEAEVGEAAPEPPTQEGAEGTGQMQAIDVYSVLRLSIAQLAGVAWQTMGLQPDPFTKQIRRDSAQARVAIDATAALVEQLKPHLQGQEARDYQTLLTDLRLNFVSHSGGEEKS